MIHVPENYSYIEAYLTLKCNLGCKYCVNKHSGVRRTRKELDAREWAIGLNNISTSLPITLGGGEPTLKEGFHDIITNVKHKFDLLTNGTFDPTPFMRKAGRARFSANREQPHYKSIRISYHPGYSDEAQIINTATRLSSKGYRTGIFGINHPNNLSANNRMAEKCSRKGVYFFIRDFLGYYEDRLYGYYKYPGALNGNRKSCLCRIEELLIGPEGNIYRCHRDLYAGENEVGNILNMAFRLEDTFRPCDKFGLCNPCDIKLKLGKDLTTSKCSVEIKDSGGNVK